MSLKLKAVLLAAILVITAFAFAEDGGQTRPAATIAVSQPAPLPQTAAVQQPAPKPTERPLGITFGDNFRFRTDAANNTGDFTNQVNDEAISLHYRLDPWINADLGRNANFYFRFQWEPYKKIAATCTGTAGVACTAAGLQGKTLSVPFNSQALEVDSAFLKFNKLPVKNLTLQLGRFDYNLEEGFFFYGGGAGIGLPRTDGIILDYTLGKQDFKSITLWQPSFEEFFPIVNKYFASTPTVGLPANVTLMDQGDNVAEILYYTNRMLKNTDIDLYVSPIHEYRMMPNGMNQFSTQANWVSNYAQYQFEPDRHFVAWGGRIQQRFKHDILAKANFLAQDGTQDAMSHGQGGTTAAGTTFSAPYPKVDIRAYGWDAIGMKYFPNVPWKPNFGIGFEYLSGNDPKTPRTEKAFNNLWGEGSQGAEYTHGFDQYEAGGMYGYNVLPPYSVAAGQNSTKEMLAGPYAIQDTEAVFGRVAFTIFQGKKRQVQYYETIRGVYAPHPMMTNVAHYPQINTSGLTWAQIDSQILTSSAIIGGSGIPASFNCSPNATGLNGPGCTYTGGRLHRFNEFDQSITYRAAPSVEAFLTWEHQEFGNFYNSSWLQAPYTGATKVTANQGRGDYIRIALYWNINKLVSYKNMVPKL